MNIKIKEVNSFTKEIEVVVGWNDIEASYNSEFKKFSQKISMPGYRKGKVPVALVKSNYGKSFEVDFIDKNMDAGYHSVVWNADEFGSGIYFVQMIAEDYIHTQKLMLVK